MKHFPASRYHPPLDGLSQSPTAPRRALLIGRTTLVLALAVAFLAGLFGGAIVFGAVLVRHTDSQLSALNSPLGRTP